MEFSCRGKAERNGKRRRRLGAATSRVLDRRWGSRVDASSCLLLSGKWLLHACTADAICNATIQQCGPIEQRFPARSTTFWEKCGSEGNHSRGRRGGSAENLAISEVEDSWRKRTLIGKFSRPRLTKRQGRIESERRLSIRQRSGPCPALLFQEQNRESGSLSLAEAALRRAHGCATGSTRNGAVFRTILETNTCRNLDSPVEVFIDPAGDYTLLVYDD